jgi:hypothetical protein
VRSAAPFGLHVGQTPPAPWSSPRGTDTATGRSVTYNISGPGTSIAYANGDFLFDATGRNLLFLTPEQAAATGLPQLFVTSGPISVLFRADGSVEVQRLGNHLQDICAALTG